MLLMINRCKGKTKTQERVTKTKATLTLGAVELPQDPEDEDRGLEGEAGGAGGAPLPPSSSWGHRRRPAKTLLLVGVAGGVSERQGGGEVVRGTGCQKRG